MYRKNAWENYDGEERARLRRLRAKFALPARGTAEERARLFGRAVKL